MDVISTNFKSWIKLQEIDFVGYTLATYHSKLVMVGGWGRNTVLMSDNGITWKPSLPPMTTARFLPAVVSHGHLECLIVAGGKGNGEELSTVEILRDGQWSLLEPLPFTIAFVPQCVCHRGLFFLTSSSPTGRLHYCTLNSLLAAATAPAARKPNWKYLDGDNTLCSVASFGGYLVTLSHDYVYAYSPFAQSWVNVGAMPYGNSADSNRYLDAVTTDDLLVLTGVEGMAVKMSLRGTTMSI